METIEIVPRSPLNLYINLYCNKRQQFDNSVNKEDKKLLKEATKSWLSLNDTEKQAISSKYDQILADYKQKIADSLKNAKPYLRKKNHKQTNKSKNSDIHRQDQIETNFTPTLIENTSTNIHGEADDKMMSALSFQEPEESPSNINEQSNANQHVVQGTFPEPIPPSVTSGKELYVLLSTNTENRNWESLQRTEKNYYSTAVRTIKNNYIKAYRSFLENLGPKELYDYYINNKEME